MCLKKHGGSVCDVMSGGSGGSAVLELMCSSQVVTNVYCACGCIFFLSLCKKEFNFNSAVVSFSYLSFYSYSLQFLHSLLFRESSLDFHCEFSEFGIFYKHFLF